ncbi:MAG: SNF2-related protein [Defluviitaleaceae bacterium]|nr:SNF2-related protein [Defluviitaleaceae bacterium]
MRYAISNGKILDISANEDVYTRGENYYREGKLVSFHAKRQRESTTIKAAVKGNYRNYDVTLNFDNDGELTRYNCSCASQSIWQGGCRHVVAVLFAISDGKISGANKNRQNQESLIDTLEKLILQEIDTSLDIPIKTENTRLAKLVPYFQYAGEGKGNLSFYVGYSRMYIIKSLPKFLQAINQEATVRYGNGLEFNHAYSSFTASSRRWIDFLRHEDELYNEMVKRITTHYPYAAKEDNREIPLSCRNMDTFFELCKDTVIEGAINPDQTGDSLLQFTTDRPNILFDISVKTNLSCDNEELTIKGSKLQYHFLQGQQYYYFITNNIVHRMDKAGAKLLEQILDALEASGQVVLTGYAHRRFISAVMPKLDEMGLIEKNLIEKNFCPQLCAKIYFDTEASDIIGRIVFNYGENNQFDAFDLREDNDPRDIAGEYTIKRLLESLGFLADVENRIYRLSGSDNIFAFMGDSPAGIEQLYALEKSEIYVTDNLRKKTVKAGEGSIGVRMRGNLLDIYVQGVDFTLAELAETLDSYRTKKKYHRLKDGRLLSLTDSSTIAMAETLASLDIDQKEIQKDVLTLPVYRAPYIDGIVDSQNDSFKKLMNKFHSQKGDPIPKSLEGIMRPYQQAGYKWLKNLINCGFGGILADDMGLGKTLQAIALLLSDNLTKLPALVVAPTSLIYNWSAEIKKFAPKLNYAVVVGSPEKRLEILMAKDVNVFITTYDSMKRDTEIYQEGRYKYIIADEAQNIKNPSTKNAKAIKSIPAEHRIALTGTPIENNLTELWSLFDFVMPGYLHSLRKFTKLYEIPITKDGNKEKVARLKTQIAPFILRRLKKNVLHELPSKTETVLMAEMLPEQNKIYMAHLMKAKGELKSFLNDKSFKGGRLQILAQLTRLRQICCYPGLCLENYRGGSGKLNLALETIELAIESGHRCLLFSQFTEMLSILQKALDKSGIPYFYLDGSTSAHDRMDRVNQFNAGERDVFLLSLKAGGTGLNLTGADIVIHYDPWWNPSVMDQASDRAYRIGQNKAVQVFNLVTMNTLEERIMALQDKKRKLIDSVFNKDAENEEGMLQALTDAEIEELLNA